MAPSIPDNQRRLFLGILLFAVLVRLVTLGTYPLADMTEGRYAEVARKMDETDNWVTPLKDYDFPFWAKPPLSTWLTAACMRFFGVSEFTARLSSFVLVFAIGWLTYLLARRHQDRDLAILGTFILATTAMMFITAGAVMTDAALTLSSTLCMVSFWFAVNEKSRFWGYLFFVGLAGGLLSKGLVPVALTAFPIALWTLWKNKWKDVWERIPWFTGSALCLALAAPWYILAELRTPGFLNYFFIGEHLGKFLIPGWKGDMYGTAHGHPRGTIWPYWIVADLPWSLLFIGLLIKQALRHRSLTAVIQLDDWYAYLAAWTAAPMLFFTFAGNVMLTYVLSGIPAFALLTAHLLMADAGGEGKRGPRLVAAGGVVIPALIIILVSTPYGQQLLARKSQKPVVERYQELRQQPESRLVYLMDRPHSAEFYTRGKAIKATTDQVTAYLSDNVQDFIVMRNGHFDSFPEPYRSQLEQVQRYTDFTLYRERGPSGTAAPGK